MNGNSFMTFMLRSPLHGMMSGSTMLITVTGCKSGRAITTPVNYYQEGDTLWVISRRERRWWRNLRGGAPVRLRLRGQDRAGFAKLVLEETEVAKQIGEYLRRLPISARSLGVRMEDGRPNSDDLIRLAEEWLLVRVGLD